MITVTQLRAAFGTVSASVEAELDGLVTELIDSWESEAHGLWNSRTGHVQEFRVNAEMTKKLWLELRPVTSITSVEERLDGSDWVAITSGWTLSNHILVREGGHSWAPYVRVTYDGGFTANTVPGDIRRALLTQGRFLQAALNGTGLAVKSQNFEGGSGTFLEQDFHPLFKKTVAKHRRRT